MTAPKFPSQTAFTATKEELREGNDLTFEMVGNVFGQEFWMLLVCAFLDSNDAARAISGAIARLRSDVEVKPDA